MRGHSCLERQQARQLNIWWTQAAGDHTHDRHVRGQQRVLVHFMLISIRYRALDTSAAHISGDSSRNGYQYVGQVANRADPCGRISAITNNRITSNMHGKHTFIETLEVNEFSRAKSGYFSVQEHAGVLSTVSHTHASFLWTSTNHTHSVFVRNACRQQIIPFDFHTSYWDFNGGSMQEVSTTSAICGVREVVPGGETGINCLR